MSPPDPVDSVLKLARAMHTSGYAAHRLEDVLAAAAQRLVLAGAENAAFRAWDASP